VTDVGIIIQARMGSSRLPGKILMDYEGNTLLGHIISRLERLDYPAEKVIATSVLPKDDVVEEFCQKSGVICFRGSEENVLERYFECARKYGFSQIVRMTGDNPFPDISELDRLINYHIDSGHDFSENYSILPIGVGMEIMSFDALKESLINAELPKHFEHIDEYILDYLELYKHGTLMVNSEKNCPDLRLTVDTWEDYERACYILRKTENCYVTTELAIKFGNEFDINKKVKTI
jgi:Spore coat polysaccharide biosynthesis protein F, CMP-KDO synthetase homolog